MFKVNLFYRLRVDFNDGEVDGFNFVVFAEDFKRIDWMLNSENIRKGG